MNSEFGILEEKEASEGVGPSAVRGKVLPVFKYGDCRIVGKILNIFELDLYSYRRKIATIYFS